MGDATLQTTTLTAIFSVLAAVLAGTCAFLSYRLARKIHNDLKSDETVIFGPLDHPSFQEVQHEDHRGSVIGCAVFNKSRRKAFINCVQALDGDNNKLDVTWASSIDHLGNPQKPYDLMEIIDLTHLYVRRNSGEPIEYMRLKIHHSFPGSPTTIEFNPLAKWMDETA